jgi:hypothetical protein
MNKTYIDQIVRYMNLAKIKNQDQYDDVAMATGAMRWFIDTLDRQLGNCHGVENGRCQFYWKHDDCVRLMAILKDLTGNQKYSIKINQPTLWD